VEEQLSDLTVPPDQARNVRGLIDYEAQYLEMPRGWERRAACLDCYASEVDKSAHLLFCDGEFVAVNNKRSMGGVLERWRKECPDGTYLIHAMGSALDFGLIERIEEPAREHPENWVPRTGGRGMLPPGSTLKISLDE